MASGRLPYCLVLYGTGLDQTLSSLHQTQSLQELYKALSLAYASACLEYGAQSPACNHCLLHHPSPKLGLETNSRLG